jgi:hypothetical protein
MKEEAKKTLNDINKIINDAILYKQINEQWFLDFLDNLNKYSVMF